jgi:hypothetical protein
MTGRDESSDRSSTRLLLGTPPLPAALGTAGTKRKATTLIAASGPAARARSVEVEDTLAPAAPPIIESTTNVIDSSGTGTGTQEDGDDHSLPKRDKKRTLVVWEYFEKTDIEVEVDGKIYNQKWCSCKFPKCKARYRCEGRYGTTAFLNHLRSAHRIVKGQRQLSMVKDHEKDCTVVEPYKFDQAVSLRKLYLAIIMHEYPFNIVEHEYMVDFIKSLRPNFSIKSRITTRKEIMDLYLEQKDILYGCLKNVQCCFSATMDMWTSCQNKSYMCVTLHWIDDEWRIQKRIVGFFHVAGSHTGQRLSQTFTELMVKWYVEKKLFSLTLDNASANEVAVNDIIADLNENHGSLACDGLFFHVRCACHILNLVARDGMAVITGTIDNIKKLVLTVKGSPLQWEELMKRAKECGLDTSKGLSLDVSTRWNSTYLMLRDALYYKPTFMRLKYYASSPFATATSKTVPSAPQHASTYELLLETHDDELELDRFLYDETSLLESDALSELEKYMVAPLLKHSDSHFDILSWWRGQQKEYPVLSLIARNVLATQVSIVASESAFSAGGCIVDPYRSRLDPEMVEALICTKSWISATRKGIIT